MPHATLHHVDLLNCSDEAIHVPGTIQPHGALLYLTGAGLIEGFSANLGSILGVAPEPGQPVAALGLPPCVADIVRECQDTMDDGDAPAAVAALELNGLHYDCIVHAHAGRVIVEFESRDIGNDQVALFAIKAHGAIDRLRRQKTIVGLLETAVRQVREFTGFDRVMAYRFRTDDSGDVVAEARRDDLVPYVGQRYPAGDIPPQARRLYVLNTLRMIADVEAAPMALLGAPDAAPLDMSFATLRSVSPIHIEYLKNMGIGASMSVSIVINGRLWGLLACHHMTPKRVPYSVRMAADVLAQVLGSMVQSIESRRDVELVGQSATMRADLVEALQLEEDPLEALTMNAAGLLESTGAQALIVAHYGRIVCRGIEAALGEAVLASLPADATDLVVRESHTDWPAPLRSSLGKWAGLLALPFDVPSGGWCVMLRVEQLEQVAWGGKPEKTVARGPLGDRLTPRGSFDAWHETVRGSAQPWEDGIPTHARMLLAELVRVSNTRRAQTEATRAQLLAMLGHDLRDPLHSINMAGIVLEKSESAANKGKLGQRIRSSSGRMQRMIGQVLDMSRLDRGQDLGMTTTRIDLQVLVEDMVEEARLAYPSIEYELQVTGPVWVMADSDRLSQVMSNLLSNARHHGEPNQPIRVRFGTGQHQAAVCVSNAGAPIPPEVEAALFNPFKRGSMNNPRNRTGMGLGLYIAHQVVREHQGTIDYHHENGRVVFTVRLPLADALPATSQLG
jgi:chemotaxis family two-component system sensor kinase Cph1